MHLSVCVFMCVPSHHQVCVYGRVGPALWEHFVGQIQTAVVVRREERQKSLLTLPAVVALSPFWHPARQTPVQTTHTESWHTHWHSWIMFDTGALPEKSWCAAPPCGSCGWDQPVWAPPVLCMSALDRSSEWPPDHGHCPHARSSPPTHTTQPNTDTQTQSDI